MRYFFLLSFGLLFTFACSTGPNLKGNEGSFISSHDYRKIVDQFSKSQKRYEGFYNTYELNATILNSEVQNAQLKKKTEFLQWDDSTTKREREKIYQEMSSAAKFFLSFYSPESDYNNLHKPDSIWKIYLEIDGNRYEGKVKKLSDSYLILQQLYPYHTRFSTAYEITFLTPMSSLENKPATLTLTSSAGTANLIFPAVSQGQGSEQ